jgi:hypothetical protein
MYVAEQLGKYLWEVKQEMPPDEFAKWLAYFKIKNSYEKK